ncbi:serine protease [Ruegeria sp. HKCCA5014]|uniref:SDH family Clp fold serine proteinase n=1 Tax=Ruegeria sp. HKCCA5014 TaxID=2682980 RepID=UPI0014897006|nr:serine protease [Ruegeria sp. HKCCA5014]
MNQPNNGGAPQVQQLPKSETESRHEERKTILEQIGAERNSKALLYVTGDRPAMETQIGPDVDDIFVEHLDALWPAQKISLVLYTTGGNTATAWRLINLLRTFCDELEIIVLVKALSSGTLMCLGANQIVMSKQSTLGPIDPSLNSPLNPQVPGTNPPQRAPVSVEAVQGYLDVAKSLGVNDSGSLATVLTHLSSQIHPLVLGQIFRTRTQIRDLAKKLLVHQDLEDKKKEEIIDFLCSESGSHDHTMNRREATELGLKIEKPSAEFYEILKNMYDNVSSTLKLRDRFSPDTEVANNPSVHYRLRRGLIESADCGSHQFITEGVLTKVQVQQAGAPPAIGFQDNRLFEGWQREQEK